MKNKKTKKNKNSSQTNEFHAPIVVCRIPRGLLVVKQQFTKKRNEYWLITTKEQSFLIPKDLSIDWRTNRGKSAPSFSFIIMFILWLIKEFIIIQFSNSSFFLVLLLRSVHEWALKTTGSLKQRLCGPVHSLSISCSMPFSGQKFSIKVKDVLYHEKSKYQVSHSRWNCAILCRTFWSLIRKAMEDALFWMVSSRSQRRTSSPIRKWSSICLFLLTPIPRMYRSLQHNPTSLYNRSWLSVEATEASWEKWQSTTASRTLSCARLMKMSWKSPRSTWATSLLLPMTIPDLSWYALLVVDDA